MKLKIGSLNVKNLLSYQDRYQDILSLILENDFDIICFQEMTHNAIVKLAKDTNMSYKLWFSNGILTKLKISNFETYKLVAFRGGLKATLLYDNNGIPVTITVMVTHLDDLREDVRIKQFLSLKPYLNDVDFLIGDFNSLHKKDYSDETFNELNNIRLKCKLEKARTEVIDLVKSNGFNINPFITPTCSYNTRVDYIFYKLDFINKYKIVTKNDDIIDTISSNISDHNLLISDIKT